ncbi:ATP-binding protein [Planomonospora sp. ID91781]|uniref:AAA family ATPase n=1 Tax=Planomonospora sp. ID91781 TaxID=2738135 RepID=UPI0018C38028|nr:ATP-binding protein [Planomonospora sp. ID91781]MBG0824907.1 ATP-binding protein [Planomonospora sp. ID91781]
MATGNRSRAPVLTVVSGPPGSGKTTLARELVRALGFPLACRDEIKQGMVHRTPADGPDGADLLNRRTLAAFFTVLETLLRAGVSVIAEAAFQDRLWRPGLEPLAGLAEIRVIRCTVDAAVAHERIARRAETDAHRAAHADHDLLTAIAAGAYSTDSFVGISLPVPTLTVDTAAAPGYDPGLRDVAAFAAGTVKHVV